MQDDLISRQDAIEIARQEIDSGTYTDIAWKLEALPSAEPEIIRCKDCLFWKNNNGGYPNMNCKWIDDETPDADDFCSFARKVGTKKNGWIPVEERLPEQNGMYLVTTSSFGILRVEWNTWADGKWLYPDGKPIAWRPPIEPYCGADLRGERI